MRLLSSSLSSRGRAPASQPRRSSCRRSAAAGAARQARPKWVPERRDSSRAVWLQDLLLLVVPLAQTEAGCAKEPLGRKWRGAAGLPPCVAPTMRSPPRMGRRWEADTRAWKVSTSTCCEMALFLVASTACTGRSSSKRRLGSGGRGWVAPLGWGACRVGGCKATHLQPRILLYHLLQTPAQALRRPQHCLALTEATPLAGLLPDVAVFEQGLANGLLFPDS